MWIAIIILGAAAALFAALFFLSRRNIRNARRELWEINADPETNSRVHCAVPDWETEHLLQEVNRILDGRQEDRIRYVRQERELRQQISNISHDLRTPLTSILGYLELIEDPAATEEERIEYLSVVKRRAKVLQTLITSFYDLSRIEANEFVLETQSVQLYDVLSEIMAAFYPDFTARGFNVLADIDRNTAPIAADRTAVTRVYSNLVQNALRHGERNIFLSQKQVGKEIVTRFCNDAPGMKPEDIEHVFDRFFTADQMRTGQDTGLGLTIAQKFVEKMGGTITASLAQGEAGYPAFTIEIHWPVA